MAAEAFNEIKNTLSNQPGVYKFLDAEGNILYVGKAKNLKKRVSSYFMRPFQSRKIDVLVKKTAKIDCTVVETEQDALLLENSLIKEFQPRYNIQMRDDKSYPYLCIKNERFPRIFLTRTLVRDGSEYLGPFTSLGTIRTILGFVRTIFPLRNCNFNLSESNIQKRKFKVCLEYHIGNCKAPCEGHQDTEDYDIIVQQIRKIIKGNINSVIDHLTREMEKEAGKYNFEKANYLKEKIEKLKRYQSKSTVVTASIEDVDVFSIDDAEDRSFVNYIKIINGAVIQTITIELIKKLEESKEEMLVFGINQLRSKFQSTAKEIIVPFEIEPFDDSLKITVPKAGDKKKLLELSEKNLFYFIEQKKQTESLNEKQSPNDFILTQTQKDFKIPDLPVHIECFDNSNIQGEYPVASLVVFRNGKPYKKDYRHFNIKTVEGPNDFASMEEIVYRRYKRLLEDKLPLPQLIIIDGGKGQLSSALKSIKELGIEDKVTIISIAKKLEEIYRPYDSVPMHLSKKSPALMLVQRIRNEAHRFAITFHRSQRARGTIKTGLTEIKGIGENTAKELLSNMKSIKKIRAASLEELSVLIGKSKAKIVYDFFNT